MTTRSRPASRAAPAATPETVCACVPGPWTTAPAGTPPEVISKLHSELVQVLSEPEVQEKFRVLGLDIIGNTPDEFAAFLKKDIVKWAKVVKDSGAKAN